MAIINLHTFYTQIVVARQMKLLAQPENIDLSRVYGDGTQTKIRTTILKEIGLYRKLSKKQDQTPGWRRLGVYLYLFCK